MQRRILALSAAAAVLIPFFGCFGEALFTSRSFAHRDGSRFYRPLFEWTQNEWDAGRIPLWNPQENTGGSVVGDTTSSVFYPGKAVFFLPVDFDFRYKLFICLHVLGAATFTGWLARRWRASVPACGLAAVSYAFGGYVLFQHTNVVFLVGATWLPASLLALDRMLRRRSLLWAMLFGVVLGVMTLGGDPQTAYISGLLAVLYAMMLRRRHRRRRGLRRRVVADINTRDSIPSGRRFSRHRFTLLAAAAMFAAILAAVQIIPSLESSSRSTRAVAEEPHSLYAISAVLSEDEDVKLFRQDKSGPWVRIKRGIFGSPKPHSQHRGMYRYSIQPMQLMELAFPNAGGKTYPINRRVLLARLDDIDPWVPSLYVGVLPLVLAFGAWRLRRGAIRDRWLSWCVLLAVICSLGWYGPGWLMQAANLSPVNDAGEPAIGEPVGGLYWLMVVVLPGFDQFRYPAKLFVVASLGMSLLAARGWDRMCRDPRRTRAALRWLGIFAAVLLASVFCGRAWIENWLAAAPPDPSFGPISVDGAHWVIYSSIAHTMLVCAIGWWLCRGVVGARSRSFQAAILVLSALELTVAQRWMVALTTDDFWAGTPWAVAEIANDAPPQDALFRVHRAKSSYFIPDDWSRTSSPQRQSEMLGWHRATLFPRTHLLTRVALAEAETSLVAHDFRTATDVSRMYGPRLPGDVSQLHPLLVDALGVRYILQPDRANVVAQQAAFGRRRIAAFAKNNATLWYNPDHFARAWIVHSVERLPKVDSKDAAVVESITIHAFFPRGRTRDLRNDAMVETSAAPSQPDRDEVAPAAPPRDACHVIRHETQRVEIHAELSTPGLVVLSDYYDPDWKADVTDQSTGMTYAADVVRTNRIMRGVFLPSGRFTITYTYQPRAFRVGSIVSTLGWIVLGIVVIWKSIFWRRRRKSTRPIVVGRTDA